ncbi:universal stress protein [Streptomyces sp. NBC_00191]|uniref:universal stress protein n=1 Tax=Streptomyces sp. NBC_00191 TaxID=2975674 RepID=UPI0038682F41
MLRSVVVGVDGSAESFAAAEWAAQEAVLRNLPLRVIHARAWTPDPPTSAMSNAAARHVVRRILREAEARITASCPGIRL